MIKRRVACLVGAGALAASVLGAPAQAAVTVPEEVQIEDPYQDANFLNDQRRPGLILNGEPVVPDDDDHVTPEDTSATVDIGKVWFSNTAETVSVHIQTEAPAPTEEAVRYDVFTNPGEGTVASDALNGCLRFVAVVPGTAPGGGTYQGPAFAKLNDFCNDGSSVLTNSVDAELTIEELEDGSGVLTITGPRDYSPITIADDAKLTTPYAETTLVVGGSFTFPGPPPPPAPSGITQPATPARYDTTKRGTDFELTVDEPEPVLCAGFEDIAGNHVIGTIEADTLEGTAERDIICGLEGDDTLKGLDGDDLILGGAGLDRIEGGAGNDDLRGEADNDQLYGGAGNDKLNGGPGDDLLSGGKGTDKCKAGGGKDTRKSCE